MLAPYRCATILQGANTRKVEMCGSAIQNGVFDRSWVDSMLQGQRIVTFLQGAEMEDGENGAKHLWNGYTREKILFLFFYDF